MDMEVDVTGYARKYLLEKREEINKALAVIDGYAGRRPVGRPPRPTTDEATPPQFTRVARRKMSPQARKRLSEMMKKRWAERRAQKAATTPRRGRPPKNAVHA
jgi:hypothetical protein